MGPDLQVVKTVEMDNGAQIVGCKDLLSIKGCGPAGATSSAAKAYIKVRKLQVARIHWRLWIGGLVDSADSHGIGNSGDLGLFYFYVNSGRGCG